MVLKEAEMGHLRRGKKCVIVGCWEVELIEVEKGYLSRSEIGVIRGHWMWS